MGETARRIIDSTQLAHPTIHLNNPMQQNPSSVSIIVARARNGIIGKQGALPWHLPEDLAHFKATTTGHAIIMGRKTWDSIGRPLPKRRNIVVTRNADWSATGAEAAPSLAAAVALCGGDEEAFIIGGAQLYDEALAMADKLIVTEIDRDFEGDTWLPAPDPMLWRESARETHRSTGAEPFDYAFVTYLRASPDKVG